MPTTLLIRSKSGAQRLGHDVRALLVGQGGARYAVRPTVKHSHWPSLPCAATALALVFGTTFHAIVARAENPVDAENQKLAERAAQLGKKPEGVLPLFELFNHWDESTPAHTLSLLD